MISRIRNKYKKLKEMILPLGTKRRRGVDRIKRLVSVLKTEGLRAVWIRIRNNLPQLSFLHMRPSEVERQRQNNALENYENMLLVASNQLNQDYVTLSNESWDQEGTPVKLIAFYLPQFHPIPENDEWWGKGFTEWTNVSKAVPQFVGHYQPHLPGELGFYDLRVPQVQYRQVELARQYGIYGFCFYYYWFHGKRLLELPLNQFLNDPNIDFPFCICWANENWTRRWDGYEEEILIGQEHSVEEDLNFIRDIAPILKHKNYIRIKGRPILVIYRAGLLPDPASTAKRWRAYCKSIGLEEPFLIAAQTFFFYDPTQIGFDAAVQFPPHSKTMPNIKNRLKIINPDFKGNVVNYADAGPIFGDFSARPKYKLFHTVFPSWDNEPRKPGRGYTFAFSTPEAYKEWLISSIENTIIHHDSDERIVFINAWNEWAEGAHLEPDRRFGYAYLQATMDALKFVHDHKK